MTWYMAGALCGGLVLVCLAGAHLWWPAVSRPEHAALAALAAALAGAAAALVEPEWVTAIRPILIFGLLSAVTVVHLSTLVIPHPFVIVGLAMGGLLLWQQPGEVIPALVAASTCAFGLLVLDSYVGQELGMGVVALGGLVGLVMGWPVGPLGLVLFLLLGAGARLLLIHCGDPSQGAGLPILPLLAPAVLLQWIISHSSWIDPAWEMMLMVAGFAAFWLANRQIRSR